MVAARFAVIGDYGNDSPDEAAVAAMIAGWNPDFILTVGDNVYLQPLSLEKFDLAIGQYYHQYIGNYSGQFGAGSTTNRFFPTLGNHDYIEFPQPARPDVYLEYFDLPGTGFSNSSGNERYYDFVSQGIHFFALSAELNWEPDGATATSAQAQWLQAALASSTESMNVVYFHNAPYSSGGGEGSSPHMRWPFAQWGADVVFAGHEHIYERLNVEGIPYFISGLGGAPAYALAEFPLEESQFRYNANHGAMLVTVTDELRTFEFYSAEGGGTLVDRLVQYQQPTVLDRQVFYNNSKFDFNLPGVSQVDLNAVAPDKTALLPGQTASFANYTSYSKGLNGVMIDISGVPQSFRPQVGDFQFRVGNDNSPSGWALAPAPSAVTVFLGHGVFGSERIVLAWPDGAIKKQWLEVTLLPTANTGLAAADVFYFGNAVGEAGNSTTGAVVSAADELLARVHSRTPLDPAPITDRYDYNRDGLVNAADQILARVNSTTPLSALRLIAPPAVAPVAAALGPAELARVAPLAPAPDESPRRRPRRARGG